jgi:hypothetical protein
MLYVVDVGRDETFIHRLDLDEGKYLRGKRLRGTMRIQVMDFVWMVEQDRCNRIIFDEMGYGRGFKDLFNEMVKDRLWYLDEFGNVKLKEEPTIWEGQHNEN